MWPYLHKRGLVRQAAKVASVVAGVDPGVELGVDAQAVEHVGVRAVVGELAQGREAGAHRGGGGGAVGKRQQLLGRQGMAGMAAGGLVGCE